MSSDPIADLLTKIRNAGLARRKETEAPHSKIKEMLVKILKQEGLIEDYKIEDQTIRIYLKFFKNHFIILGLERISKPGLRRYIKVKKIRLDRSKINIISTSQGLMTDREAFKKKLGGEILCQIR